METKKEISEVFYKKANDLLYEIKDLADEEKLYRIALFLESVCDEAYEQGEWDGKNEE